MKHDDLGWLATELGLPSLEETAKGLVVRGVVQPAVGEQDEAIVRTAAAIIGADANDPALIQTIDEARRGMRHSAVIAVPQQGRSWRVIAHPIAAGHPHVRVVLAPITDALTPRERIVDVAAAVSHEVANAVGAIRGWADLALAGSEVDLRSTLTLIGSAARNAEHAARSMLTLARTGSGATADPPRPLDLSDITRDLLRLLTLTAREAQVTLDANIAPDLTVSASRAQLFTIFFNLIKNAIEACKAGGRVTIALDGDDEQVRFSVRDSGEGLDSDGKRRLFEPYYTTKVHGTGLGLVLVREAVRDSGAQLEVESERGKGTAFHVLFPRIATEPSDTSRVAPMPTAERGEDAALSARVLVVDDDHALREMLATALSLRGAEVVSVRSPEEALALAGPFDIALVDMLLEGARGDELLAQLRQRGVVDAAMLVTGTVNKPRLVSGGEPDDWVRKPFEIPQLVERIRRTLAHRQSPPETRSKARMQ